MGRAYRAHVVWRRGRKNPKLVQDGNRQFITVVEAVSAAGGVLPPLVIDKGKAHYMGWHAHVSKEEPAFFGISEKGWTDNELGVLYLEKVFEPQTAAM